MCRHSTRIQIDVCQTDLVIAQIKIPRRARRAVVGATGQHDPSVRSVGPSAEAEHELCTSQRQRAGGHLVERGRKIGARLGQGPGQRPLAGHGPVDRDRANAERSAGVPIEREPQSSAEFNEASGRSPARRAGKNPLIDLDLTTIQETSHLQAGRRTQKTVQFLHARAETVSTAIEADLPGGPRAG